MIIFKTTADHSHRFPFQPSEPATVSVAPVITQPPAQITQPAVAPVSSAGYGAGYGAPAPPTSSYGGAGYGSGSASFNSQPPKQYGNEETMHKQVRILSTGPVFKHFFCGFFLDFQV